MSSPCEHEVENVRPAPLIKVKPFRFSPQLFNETIVGDLNIEISSKHEAFRKKLIHFETAAGSFVNLSNEHVKLGKRTRFKLDRHLSYPSNYGNRCRKICSKRPMFVRDYYDLCNEKKQLNLSRGFCGNL